VAASAAAAVLAACGGSSATDTPKPATSAAPTTAASAAAATRPAGSATSAPAGTTAPSGTTAAGTTTSATTAAGSATTGTTSAGTTSAAAVTVAPAAMVRPDAYKGRALNFYKGLEYYKAVQDFVTQEVTNFLRSGGGSAEIAIQSDQGSQNLAKIQAGVETGNPFDLVDGRGGGVQQLVTLNLVQDVTDLVKEMTDKYGQPMPILAQGLVSNGKWYAVPWSTSSDAWFLRKDKLDAKGIKPENLKTYDDFRDAALAISDPANKFYGWGNSVYPTGDGTTLIFHVIHNWGGAITDKTGTKVTFNSPETVAGVTWLADIYQNPKYKTMLPPGWESWTDSSNNEAFLNGSIGFTANAFTLYAKAHDDKNPVFPNTVTAPRPTGPAHPEGLRGGQLGYLYIARGAKNTDLAKDVIRHLIEPEVWNKYAAQAGALVLPAYESQWKLPYMTGDFRKDPNYAPLETQVRDKAGYDQIYYPAPPNPGTDGVSAQNVLLDMMAQILQKNAKPADAVRDAHDRMVKIFEQLGYKQS
jgi:multiple sugar transport system substrate-binding protein